MSKQSARIVILTGILSGLAVEQIIADAKEKALVTKEDSAIKKDINWYKSYAKKEGLVDAEMNLTDAGKEWLKNGGKKPKAEKPVAEKKETPAKKPAPKAPAKKPAATRKPAAKKPVAKKPEAKEDEAL